MLRNMKFHFMSLQVFFVLAENLLLNQRVSNDLLILTVEKADFVLGQLSKFNQFQN